MVYEGYFKGIQKGGRLLRNGDIIPILGFGTGTEYFERPDAVAEGIILAFKAGYRLIDTAQVNTIFCLEFQLNICSNEYLLDIKILESKTSRARNVKSTFYKCLSVILFY